MQEIAKRKGKKAILEVLDDGSGHGIFLSELKEKMDMLRVPIRTTAVTLKASDFLEARKESGSVHEIIQEPIETMVPRRRYDAIFSLLGGMNYVTEGLARESLLKYAHALNIGGFAAIGLMLKKGGHTQKFEEFKRRVKKSFEKRGFKADFFYEPNNTVMNLPSDILILRRIK